MRPRKQVRQTRVEHVEPPEIAADEGQNWAVSYSDLLMVLMSFFILFFSFEKDKRQNLVSEIALTMRTTTDKSVKDSGQAPQTQVKGSGGTGSAKVGGSSGSQYSDLSKTIANLLPKGVRKEEHADSLVVSLPKDIFRIKRFKITRPVARALDEILKVVLPYKNNVDLYFVGHADSSWSNAGGGIISNNFILSSLRATSALEYSIRFGFPATHLFAQGAADNLQNSRTISIRIVPRKSPLAH